MRRQLHLIRGQSHFCQTKNGTFPRLLLVLASAFTAAALAIATSASAETWIFRRSAYSHDPETGQRVVQYAQEQQSYLREDDTYMESGYRHIHVGLRGADGSYDHTNVVQTWGLGTAIRPYGEWEFPYRAGATPYGPWGNPQGPWTLPFDSWVNPYGLGSMPFLNGQNAMPYAPYGGANVPYGGPNVPYGGANGPYGNISPHAQGPNGGMSLPGR
jgi:hypothetical protein